MTVEYHNPELLQWRPHIFLGYELGMAIIGTFLVAVSHGHVTSPPPSTAWCPSPVLATTSPVPALSSSASCLSIFS